MARPSDEQQRALAGLLGLGNHSARKSHYPELAARLEDLETERNRYKWLFENAVHGIFQASLQAGMRAANPALARMLGYQDPQEVLFSLADLAGNLFVGGAGELAAIGEQLQNQRSLLGYETQLRRKDGSSIDVLMNLLLKPDQDGLVEGFVADITERKLAQQHLEQLNDQLEQRVAARTDELLDANRNLQQQIARRERIERDLREARDAAEAANRSKDKYLAAASHDSECRTPADFHPARAQPAGPGATAGGAHPPGPGRRRGPAHRPAGYFQARSGGGEAGPGHLPPG